MAGPQPTSVRKNLTTRVVEALRTQIVEGQWGPGDKLPTEPALIEQFKVSRTVIREAIAELRADGLVQSRHGAGVFVLEQQPSPVVFRMQPLAARTLSDIIEELELRAAVEIEAAGLAAERASPAQEADIEARYQQFAHLARQKELTAEADYLFHIAIARATNNAHFENFLAQLGRRTIPREKLRTALNLATSLPNRDEALSAEHKAVAEAIARNDPNAARTAMRAHLMGSVKRYRALARRSLAVENSSDS